MSNKSRDKSFAKRIKDLGPTYFAISTLALFLYIGFGEVLSLLSSEIAKSAVGASISVIFVIMTTMFMLNKQTEVESKRDFDDEILRKKLQTYGQALAVWGSLVQKQAYLNNEERSKCIQCLLDILIVGPISIVTSAKKITALITNGEHNSIGVELVRFAELAREDLELPNATKAQSNLLDELGETLDFVSSPNKNLGTNNENAAAGGDGGTSATGAKNRDKFIFNDKELGKGRLVLEVVKYVSNSPKISSFADLQKEFPDELASKGKPNNNRNNYIVRLQEEAEEKNLRYFNEIIVLKSQEKVVICNQWGDNIDYFIEKMEAKDLPGGIVRLEG